MRLNFKVQGSLGIVYRNIKAKGSSNNNSGGDLDLINKLFALISEIVIFGSEAGCNLSLLLRLVGG